MKIQKLANSNRILGFTLIEVLLGLTIFAIIATCIYNMLWMGFKIDNRANDINKSFQEARLSFELITKELENACYYDFSSSYPKESSFKGDSDQISFLIPSDDGIKYVQYHLGLLDWGKISKIIIGQHVKKLKQITLVSKEDLPIRFLIREESLLTEHLSENKVKEPQKEILAAGIKKDTLNFSYGALKKDSQGQNTKTQELEFKDSWDEDTLPNVVKVRMTLYDEQDPQRGVILQRDIYLIPQNVKQ